MIKGRYVCQVEVDFGYDKEKLEIKYNKLHDVMMSDWMERTFQAKVAEIFESGNPQITVTRQYADIMEERE